MDAFKEDLEEEERDTEEREEHYSKELKQMDLYGDQETKQHTSDTDCLLSIQNNLEKIMDTQEDPLYPPGFICDESKPLKDKNNDLISGDIFVTDLDE